MGFFDGFGGSISGMLSPLSGSFGAAQAMGPIGKPIQAQTPPTLPAQQFSSPPQNAPAQNAPAQNNNQSPFGQSLNSQTQLSDLRNSYSQRPQQMAQQQNPYGMQQQAQMQNPFMGGMDMTGYGGYNGQMQNPYMGGMGYGMQQMQNPYAGGYGMQQMQNPYSGGYGMQQMQNPYAGGYGMGYGMPQMQNPYMGGMGGMGYGMPQMQNPYMGGMQQMQNPYGSRGGFDRQVGGMFNDQSLAQDETYRGYQQQMGDLRNKMMQYRQDRGPQAVQGPTARAEDPYDYEQLTPSGKPITGPQYGPDRRNEYHGMSQIGRMMAQVRQAQNPYEVY